MKKNKIDLKGLFLISHISYSFIAPVFLGVFLGGQIDKIIETDGLFMTIFIVLGSITGIYNIYKISNEYAKRKWNFE